MYNLLTSNMPIQKCIAMLPPLKARNSPNNPSKSSLFALLQTVCCAWMSTLLSSVLSLLLSDPAPPASHCAGAGAVCHLPLIFCHAPPLPPPPPRPPVSGSSTAEGLITVSAASNRHSCLLIIILCVVCCPVCWCSDREYLPTVPCERGGRCPRYNCADTQNTGWLSTAWQSVTM